MCSKKDKEHYNIISFPVTFVTYSCASLASSSTSEIRNTTTGWVLMLWGSDVCWEVKNDKLLPWNWKPNRNHFRFFRYRWSTSTSEGLAAFSPFLGQHPILGSLFSCFSFCYLLYEIKDHAEPFPVPLWVMFYVWI